MRRFLILAFVAIAASTCSRVSDERAAADPDPADERVRALADAYVGAYLDQFPEQVTYYGIPGRRHDRLSDNSLAALARWQAREDELLADVRTVDPATIGAAPLRATYAILKEALESAANSRVCRAELWNVSHLTGWQVAYGYLPTIQPVGSDEARREALARWTMLPGVIRTEITNLREGLKRGYSSPQNVVRLVIGQIRSLAATPSSETPFLAPARSDKDAAFVKAFTELVSQQIVPAVREYADFLEREYLPAARTEIAVSANPNGAQCYPTSVRAYSTLPLSAKEVHDVGLREVATLRADMKAIAERSFGTGDVAALLKRFRTERQFLFRSREELLGYAHAALARARAAAPAWFGMLPKADVRIEPYPAFREREGVGEYNPPSEDGTRPGLFYISAYQPQTKLRADSESTVFHETLPGHHLQIAVALQNKNIHPIGRYLYISGYGEGWALYAERLADEMKLFSGDVDRLGMLANQSFRAARLVVDSGIHAFGWSRQQAIDYLLAHSTLNANEAASEIDRYIVWPGQATAYMLGRIEIAAAREEAQKTAGARFDIKTFHDRVLEDGTVPLPFLREKIRSAFSARP